MVSSLNYGPFLGTPKYGGPPYSKDAKKDHHSEQSPHDPAEAIKILSDPGEMYK